MAQLADYAWRSIQQLVELVEGILGEPVTVTQVSLPGDIYQVTIPAEQMNKFNSLGMDQLARVLSEASYGFALLYVTIQPPGRPSDFTKVRAIVFG
jgi:hypothetical protein